MKILKPRIRSWSGSTLILASMAALAGCDRAKILNPSPSDALRAENLELREKVDRLSQQNKELQTRFAERRADTGGVLSRIQGSGRIDPEVDAAIPRVASVQIEGATEAIRFPADRGGETMLRLWVLPRDGQGRFLQIVGTVNVAVTVLQPGKSPVEIARGQFTPAAVRNAWRSGFMGSHYSFELPLSRIPEELAAALLTVTIRFDDALSGRSFEDERRIAAPREAGGNLAPTAP